MNGWEVTGLVVVGLWALRVAINRYMIRRGILRGMGRSVLSDPTVNRRVWKCALLWFVPHRFMWRRERRWQEQRRRAADSITGKALLDDPGEQVRRASW